MTLFQGRFFDLQLGNQKVTACVTWGPGVEKSVFVVEPPPYHGFNFSGDEWSEGMSPELEVRVLLVPGLPLLVVKAAGVKPLEEKSCRFKMEDVSFCNCECLPKGSQRYLDNPGSARHCLCILVNVYVPS